MERETGFVVAYAKISLDKGPDGSEVVLQGVYYGGLVPSHIAAEQLARECVNKVRGATVIIPHISELDEDGLIYDALCIAEEHFQRIMLNMKESSAIYARK